MKKAEKIGEIFILAIIVCPLLYIVFGAPATLFSAFIFGLILFIRIFFNKKNKLIDESKAKEICGFSVASLVFSLLFFIPIIAPLLASILGLIAKVKISSSKGRLLGIGMARAGLTLSTIQILITTIIIYPTVAEYTKTLKMANNIAYAIDSDNPITRNFAVDLAKKYPGEFNFNQVCSIYKFIKNNWKYVNDPKEFEYFSPASETIKLKLSGDCDDFAIVMAATLQAIGANTRVVMAYGEKSGHAYAEVNMGEKFNEDIATIRSHFSFLFIPLIDNIWYQESDDGNWLNLDWTAEHPGGEYFCAKEGLYIYPNGKYKRVRFKKN